MKPAISNSASAGVYPGPLQNSMQKKSGRGPGPEELLRILRFPFNISAISEASDFKFGTQFGFSEAHHKITPIGKVGVVLG